MMTDATKNQEIAPDIMPEITPDMVQTTFMALESKGMVQYVDGGYYVPTESGWKLLMEAKPVKEEIIAYGHPNITGNHTTTFEFTKAAEISKEADCIIGVKANKGCKDLSKDMKDALKMGKRVEITIEADGIAEKVEAMGSPALKLTHPDDIVVRKSDFIDGRTLAILSDKAANELSQNLIEKLRDPKTEIRITLEIG
jgi:hypothetical protein